MKIRDSGMPEEKLWESFFSPGELLSKLDLTGKISSAAELGCGYGTFTIEAAKRVKENIFAFDIEKEMLEITDRKAAEQNLENIKTIRRDFIQNGTGLPYSSVDYVMLFNILHHEEPLLILREAFRILKPAGLVGIIHWIYDKSTPRGPDLTIRPKPQDVIKWIMQSGFNLKTEIIALPPYHYGIVGKKPDKL